MKTSILLPSSFILLTCLCGCRTEIEVPPLDYPVFGPYMTAQGNQVKNPISWGKTMIDPFLVWDAVNAEYVLAAGTDPKDRWAPTTLWVYRHYLLADILQSSSCYKKAYNADGKDGVWGPIREPAFVKGADGKWRLYATALSKKDDESTRREVVFESATGRCWSDYRFVRWNEKRTVVASKLFGYDCKALLRPANGVAEISSVTPFKSPDGRETWLVYAAVDPTLPAAERHPLACVQKLATDAAGKPIAAETEPFGTWRICPSGEPPVNVTADLQEGRTMKSYACVLAGLLAGCQWSDRGTSSETSGLVRTGGYEIGAAWARKEIGGRAFVPFDTGNYPKWGQRGFEQSEQLKNLSVFRDLAFWPVCGVRGGSLCDVRQSKLYSRDWVSVPKSAMREKPYAPADMVGDLALPADRPFMLSPWNCRPAYFLHDGYKADRAAYAAWKAAHPNFLGFKVLSEYDNDINVYNTYLPSQTNAAVRELLMKRLPIARTDKEWIEQLKTVLRREQELCFGEKDLTWALNSVSCSLAHRYAAAGIKGLVYEADPNVTGGPWAFGGTFTRGAARQWGLPFVWYCAHYVGKGYTRDGKPGNGEMEWPGSWLGYEVPRAKAVRWKGAGRSLLKREMAYGAFNGASGLFPENAHFFLYADGPDGKKIPSPLAEDFNEVYEMAKDGRCGVPYTPVAMLSSLNVNCSRHGYTNAKAANLPQMAFVYTLVPACVNKNAERCAYHHSDRKAGDLGCFYNSPFGEIWDVIAPDAGQPTADLEKALSAYKCAFLVGKYEKETLDTAALVNYVKNGGTLFVSADQLDLLPSFDKVPAKSLALPEAGMTAYDFGRGRIVVMDAFKMIGKDHSVWTAKDPWTGLVSGEINFPELKALLLRVQDETMPCRVAGSCQWGVNKTADGWFFWAFNNRGVTKFVGEEEDLDPKATAHVSVTFKREAGGASFAFDLPAGGIFYKEVQ